MRTMATTDTGSTGKKLSKSSDDTLERRNKSYEKLLDLQIAWIIIKGEGKSDDEAEAYSRWRAKSAWHEREFGW